MRAREFIVEYKKYPTMDYEGVTFTMVEKEGQLIVKALNDGGIAMGHVIFNIDGKELDPQDLEVEEKYQGQGIAGVMDDYIKSRGFIINRSWDQTDAGSGFWNKHRGEDVRVWEESNSTNVISAEKLWDYVSKIHPKDQQGGGFLKSLVMLNPQYELKRIPLSSLHIPNDEDDGNDPYGRAMHVDVDHAEEYSQYEVDKKPLVVDSQGYILDGAHRAWAASELLNKKDIMAYVPVKTRAITPQDLEIRKKFTKQGVDEALTRRDMLKGLAGAAAVGATGAQAGQFIDYDKLIKDPELETVWVPRMQKLQQRSNVMLSKLVRTAGAAWAEQLKGTTIKVESNEQHIQADANERSISVDLTVFWDAPEDVLAFAIGHELGHIALGHADVPSSPEQSRKDESNADNFAVRLCKALGYNKAGVFKFLYAKKGEIENINRLTSQPNSTHPTMNQRMDRARQQGFQLSKGGIQQMNTLLTHLA